MRGHARADHGHGVAVLGGQFALYVKHGGRIVDLFQQLGIIRVRLDDDVAAELFDALQLALEIHRFFPIGNGSGGFGTNALHFFQLRPAGAKDCCSVLEMLQQ
jgi:hypothetical protein